LRWRSGFGLFFAETIPQCGIELQQIQKLLARRGDFSQNFPARA
jgi:hypothetical protein